MHLLFNYEILDYKNVIFTAVTNQDPISLCQSQSEAPNEEMTRRGIRNSPCQFWGAKPTGRAFGRR